MHVYIYYFSVDAQGNYLGYLLRYYLCNNLGARFAHGFDTQPVLKYEML